MKIKTSPQVIKEFCANILVSIQHGKEHAIFTHLTAREKRKLKDLASRSAGAVFVEIGSYLGASACFIAAGIRHSGSQAKLYCVDTWQNDMMSEKKKDTYDLFLKNTAPYSDIIVPLRGHSNAMAQEFAHRVDFLFIDGNHSFEGVKADVDTWFPKLNERALVIFHDISWAKGVRRVVKEEVRLRARKEGRLPNLYWAWL